MTSVQNLLLQLSGNKYFILALICFALSCSSKQFANQQETNNSVPVIQQVSQVENKSGIYEQNPVDSIDLVYPVIKKENYKIVFILPLMLGDIDQYEHQQKSLANSALEFYMGSMIALQELTEKSKIHFDVYYFDCDYKSGAITKEIIPELQKIKPDMIIGPLSIDHLKELSPFCRENKINLISPLINSDSCQIINPYFISVRPSEKSYLAYLSRLVNNYYQGYNISIIAESVQDKEKYFKVLTSTIDTTKFGKIQSYFVNESNWRSPTFRKNMPDGKNLFIIFNKSSEVVSNSILTNLIGIQNKEETAVIAPHSWLFQNTIDLGFLQSLNSQFITDYYFDYNDSNNFSFINRYRNKYNSEPNTLGCIGYSYTGYFVSALIKKGVYFQREWLNNTVTIDSNEIIQMVRFPGHLGFQNYHMTILGYQASELKQLNLK